MSDKRDWQADMKLCKEALRDEGWSKRDQIAEQPQMSIYWLQQYAAEKERADKLEEKYKAVCADRDCAYIAFEGLNNECVSRGEYQSLLDKHTAMTKAYRAEKERTDQAEAREQKLKEALERILKITKEEADSKYYTNTITLREKIIENLFSTLYLKEESR